MMILETRTVLEVDDDSAVRETIGNVLKTSGYQADLAANGQEALENLKAGKFDLVITDRGMPEMNGDQLAVAIREVASDVPIIMLMGVGEMMEAAGEKRCPTAAILSGWRPFSFGPCESHQASSEMTEICQ